jgi:hypothetical protein
LCQLGTEKLRRSTLTFVAVGTFLPSLAVAAPIRKECLSPLSGGDRIIPAVLERPSGLSVARSGGLRRHHIRHVSH